MRYDQCSQAWKEAGGEADTEDTSPDMVFGELPDTFRHKCSAVLALRGHMSMYVVRIFYIDIANATKITHMRSDSKVQPSIGAFDWFWRLVDSWDMFE